MGHPSDLHPQNPPEEYEVKAAFLYNFAKFVEWPEGTFPDANAPLVIGVLGEDPFGDVLDRTIAGKQVQGRPLRIRRWNKTHDVEGCQILFISSSEQGSMATILDKLRAAPLLTVSDADDFDKRGGIIHFVMQENRVRFEINNHGAQTAGLKISSRLLMLALRVWE
jgi:hypothetical protein